jgi:hypothetical protein
MVQSPWRIVTRDGVIFSATDDGHKFGLPSPLDGEAVANELLAGSTIVGLEVDRTTADVTITFDNHARVDIFTNSVGYEGWHARFETDRDEIGIIGLGGGKVGFTSIPRGSGQQVLVTQVLPDD